ncbi:thioesterase [Oleiphilus sp. HI0009]|uniref:acyl-CoA thioesterase n=1 Tax=unclassified Oleiphilus TaxID=2631174 RepID=UPI0007C249B5|nr:MULTISPECIES: thioesterase family protein [unclassified Oleiphilus]KZX75250.1 thioesterase [Oleiphilus sp. HI0009]KZY69841.1 thioesterase [Oleiphilus sp. HI0067]KZY72303.1 thioesterase [Oleiphilus sp. HI0066]KZZ57249.1 thioesterase [Oleiphilus sp. HI0125]
MFTQIIQPRFAETDALGHINNATLPVWFEQSRTPIFKIFVPSLNPKQWNLILAKVEVEYTGEMFYASDVTIKTGVKKLGNSSLQVYQEAWQNERLCAKGLATMVHFNHQDKKSEPIPNDIRAELEKHLIQSA